MRRLPLVARHSSSILWQLYLRYLYMALRPTDRTCLGFERFLPLAGLQLSQRLGPTPPTHHGSSLGRSWTQVTPVLPPGAIRALCLGHSGNTYGFCVGAPRAFQMAATRLPRLGIGVPLKN